MSAGNGAVSPAGDRHPGDIVHDDKVAERQWTARAEDIPQSIAWVRVGDAWRPVIRIEITGSEEQREFTKFGLDGEFLETTVQSPRPRPRQPDPTPPLTPEPDR
jgi:hypothetical protein